VSDDLAGDEVVLAVEAVLPAAAGPVAPKGRRVPAVARGVRAAGIPGLRDGALAASLVFEGGRGFLNGEPASLLSSWFGESSVTSAWAPLEACSCSATATSAG